MKRFFDLPLRVALVISGIVVMFNIPSLVGIGKITVKLNINSFWTYVKTDFQKVTEIMNTNPLDLLGQLNLAESYQYSMTILFASLFVVIIIGILVAMMVLMVPRKISSTLKKGVNFFEAVPDLLVIFLFQFFVITLYQTTGLKFLQLYGVFGVKPYFVPIVTVSFLPALFFSQFLIKVFEEEGTRDYVLYGRAKGLNFLRILIVHMVRNILPLFIIQLRTIIWIILSTIYLLEYMFNIQGFTKNIQVIFFQGGDFRVLVICLLLFTLPLIVIEALGFLITKFFTGGERVSI